MALCSISSISSVQDLLQQCGLQGAWLEREIARDHFQELSCYLTEWRELAPWLYISDTEITNIDLENIYGRAGAKRVSFLKRWKQKRCAKATYLALVEALLNIKRVEDARGLCQLLTGRKFTDYK